MADHLEKYKKEFNAWCNDFDNWAVNQYPVAQKAKEAGVRPALFSIGLITFLILFSLWKCGQNTTSILIGFVYPTYASIGALRTIEQTDDVQWLCYWVVYAFFIACESVTDVFVSWIPLYYLLKSVFLVWLFHPKTLGARVLFTNVIDPGLVKFEEVLAVIFNQERRNDLKSKINDIKSKVAGGNDLMGQFNNVSSQANEAKNFAKKLD